MRHDFNQQLKRLEKQEQHLLHKQGNSLFTSKIKPVSDKIEGKIPEQLKATLNTAFYKGFQLVFEKGSPYIEKTYDKDRIKIDFDINNYAVDKDMNKRHMKRLDKQSRQSSAINISFSLLEGSILGFLGIGLPDILLFLSVIIKTVYETALSYGFSYDTEEERVYLLLLISAAVTKEEKQRVLDQELDQLGADIDHNIETVIDTDSQIKATSELLSNALLTAKFIQGIPVVGIIGGAVNYNIMNKISNYARIKYKKRYLLKKE